MFDAIIETVLDSVKMLPILYLTYLIMEYIEHHFSEKSEDFISRIGAVGPLAGAGIGLVPQCGFSVAVAGFYAARVVTPGTLFAVFLATSDEMLPIMISEAVPVRVILRLLAAKFLFGMAFGFLADGIVMAVRRALRRKDTDAVRIHEICEREKCSCDDEDDGREGNIFLAALKHTVQIFLFVLAASLITTVVIGLAGEGTLSGLILNIPFAGEAAAGLIGLIPNCAASVVLTELYLGGATSSGALVSGLLSASGLGVLVLFRMNRPMKENVLILAALYVFAVLGGLLVSFLGISF